MSGLSDEDRKKIQDSAKQAREIKDKIDSIDKDASGSRKGVARTLGNQNFVRQFDGIDGKTKYRITMVFRHMKDNDLYELQEAYVNIPYYASYSDSRVVGD